MTDQELIAELTQHGLEIGSRAQAGDYGAQRVIELYTMWYIRPNDPGARGLLEAVWKERRAEYESN